MTNYVPHTDQDFARMLGDLGLSSVDDLFDCIPSALRLAGGLDLPPGLSEPDVAMEMARLASENRAAIDLVCFAGGGAYDHDIPAVTRALAGRSEFVTSYTPYQPEVAQGVLQALFEYQTLVSRSGRAAGGERIRLRRRQRNGGSREPGRGGYGPEHRVGERRAQPPLAPNADDADRRQRR